MEGTNIEEHKDETLLLAQKKKLTHLKQGILDYGKSSKFLLFFILTLISSLTSFIGIGIILNEVFRNTVFQEANQQYLP